MLEEAACAILDHAKLVRPREALAIIRDDPDDDRILECAIEADAQLIVSGDRHLKNIKAFRGIPIILKRAVTR